MKFPGADGEIDSMDNFLSFNGHMQILDKEKRFHHTLRTMSHVTFHYNGQKKVVEGKEGETLLNIAINNAIPMEHACGGNGFCTTCMCKLNGGAEHLAPRNEREENMGINKDPYRLGCQARLKGGGDVEVELID